MRLSTLSTQATLALAFLASRSTDKLTHASEVAEHLGVSHDTAHTLLKRLAKRRLIQSQAGRGGGYRLDRPSESLTLLQIVEAIEGPIQGQVPTLSPTCHATGLPLLREVCNQAASFSRQQLDRVSLTDLLGQSLILDHAHAA